MEAKSHSFGPLFSLPPAQAASAPSLELPVRGVASLRTSAMAASVSVILLKSLTPLSELVVAPAGYSLHAATSPLLAAASTSAGVVSSVKYSVISGSNPLPSGTAAITRSRYATCVSIRPRRVQ